MGIINGLEQLYIFPNFLDDHECDFWQRRVRKPEFWKEIPADDHGESEQPNHYSIAPDAVLDPEFDKREKLLVEKINKRVETIFGEKFLSPKTQYFRKWVAGMQQGLHHDACYADGVLDFRARDNQKETPFPIAFHDVATVLYYNEDFEGGEIFFHHPQISLKPEQGTLIMMPCSDKYIHGVRKLTAGERYISAHFWTRAKTIAMILGHDSEHINDWQYKYRDTEKVTHLISNTARH